MKKFLFLILAVLLVLSLAACKPISTGDAGSEAVQLLADNSAAARAYADPLFSRYMAGQGISDYTIEKTAYGFFTSDTPDSVYVVAYLYSVGGSADIYGYKISVDENQICVVLDEGADVGRLLLGE
ncbi:MAG: hypothetical protein IJ466_06560 [Clostridia bacterium]|nr:hypothetical protein [Clostridia bacterium]